MLVFTFGASTPASLDFKSSDLTPSDGSKSSSATHTFATMAHPVPSQAPLHSAGLSQLACAKRRGRRGEPHPSARPVLQKTKTLPSGTRLVGALEWLEWSSPLHLASPM